MVSFFFYSIFLHEHVLSDSWPFAPSSSVGSTCPLASWSLLGVFATSVAPLVLAIAVPGYFGPKDWLFWKCQRSRAGVESSPDLEASLSLAAMIAEKYGGHSYNSRKEQLHKEGTGLEDEQEVGEKHTNVQWHTLKMFGGRKLRSGHSQTFFQS
jgi:hypothetical protein